MAIPPPIGGDRPGGRHPFGRRAFATGVGGCLLCIIAGALLLAFADGDLEAIGVTLLVLAAVCLGTVLVLSALERAMQRRPRPPQLGDGPHGRSRNGHGP